MEVIVEVVLQFVLEVVGQIVMQVLAEIGWHSVTNVFKRNPVPWLAAVGYTLFGAIAGAISLLFLPALVSGLPARVANLAIAPVLAGVAMSMIGAWRRRREHRIIRLDRFRYGYLFALALALVRFYFAK